MSLPRALRAHRRELGDAVTVYRNRPGAVTYVIAFLLWAVMPVGVIVNADEQMVANVLPPVIWGVIVIVIVVMLGGEVLVVCERGLVVGSVAPLLRPSAVPYAHLVPGTVVPILQARRFSSTTGRFWAVRTTRTGWWDSTAISFLADPSLGRVPAVSDWWFVGTGRTDPGEVTAQIARAAHRAGFDALAAATAAAEPRALTGTREDAARLMPGFT
ncbi:hypothetical protein [Georgenia deserti]|uniref:PH domain-containing protein n=1 Tax=Georgenia deserti TaxID=2093781 RepID=A0ABW4L7V9_9MICO